MRDRTPRVRVPLIGLFLLLGALVLGQWIGQASAQSPGEGAPGASAMLPGPSPVASPSAKPPEAANARDRRGHGAFRPIWHGDPKAAKDLGRKKMREFRRRQEAIRILRAQKRDMEDKRRMEMREQGEPHRPARPAVTDLGAPTPTPAPVEAGVR